jgi:2-methylcitrate dehydratase PrpD
VVSSASSVSEPTVTSRVAAFVSGVPATELSPEIVARVRDAITDAVGVALAGVREPIADILVGDWTPAGGPALVLGRAEGADPAAAALANGAIIHALDYDDTSHPAYAHPSAHLVPVILALASVVPVSGVDALLAYAIGHEIEGKLGHAMNLDHYAHGWHATGTLGAVSSAATAARLLGLSPDQTAAALAIGASMAGGLRVNFGTMTKPLHAGLAARAGIQAATLARAGFTAAADGLGGRFGYLAVMGTSPPPAGASAAYPWDALGRPWELASPVGLALKPYPACGSTHCAIEAAALLREEIAGREIVRVDVGTNTMCEGVLVFHDPGTALEAKFSMEYSVARALLRGHLTLADYTDQAVTDPATRALMARVGVAVHPRVRDNLEHGAVVRVELADGAVLERVVELAEGKPERWLSTGRLWTKFADAAAGMSSPAAAQELFTALQDLPATPDLGRDLLPLVRAAAVDARGSAA